MSPASVVKRLAVALACVAGALAAGAFALDRLVRPDDVRAAVTSALGKDGARTLAIGQVRVMAWPRPAAVLEDVALGGTGPAGMTAETVTAVLRLWPLLAGRIDVAEFVLDRPSVAIRVDGGVAMPAIAAAMPGETRPDIRVIDGTLEVRDGARIVERLANVNGAVAWSANGSSVSATGTARLRGQPVEASLGVGDLDAALAGRRSASRLRLSSPAGKAIFEGQANWKNGLQFEGTASADGPSLRGALGWLGVEPMVRGGLGRFALKGQATLSATQLALNQASLELDGNRAEGGLSVRLDIARPVIQGTLATETLNLTPYFAALSLRDAAGAWSQAPIDVTGLAAADADVRLSAARIVAGSATLGRAAASVVVRNGRLSVTLGEAQAFAGTLRGAIALGPAQPGADLRIEAAARDIDFDRLSTEVLGLRRLEGTGTLAIALEGKGGTIGAIASALDGTIRMQGRDGGLPGVNVEQLLRRIERKPLSGTGDLRGGRTAFDTLTVSLRVRQGVAVCEEVRVDSAAVKVALTGAASLGERAFDLRGTAALARPAAAGQTPFELPFVVRGPWENPSVVPDAESLIRRSGAAAPLLDALRDRNARDAVRSMMDRVGRPAEAGAEAATPGEPPATR